MNVRNRDFRLTERESATLVAKCDALSGLAQSARTIGAKEDEYPLIAFQREGVAGARWELETRIGLRSSFETIDTRTNKRMHRRVLCE